MKKRHIFIIVCISSILLFSICLVLLLSNKKEIYSLELVVLSNKDGVIIGQDKENMLYTIDEKKLKDVSVGEVLMIEYAGLIDIDNDYKIKKLTKKEMTRNEDGIPLHWLDDGIFKQFYKLAFDEVKEMSLEEKIGQILLVGYPDDFEKAINDYHIGGFLLFSNDFKDKEKEEVKKMISTWQDETKIPLLIAVDEEGGSVVRVSSNKKLRDTPFKSAQELYKEGGFLKIKEDTIDKSIFLDNLGINVNLAPVVDVATNKNSYIYNRTIGLNTKGTSEYAKVVINASKKGNVSYVLKHFPGYGNAKDTHLGQAKINESLSSIRNNYFPPFQEGINEGAEAILINHNYYSKIDKYNPASLSPTIHNLLRDDLKFSGICITDNIDMKALDTIDNKVIRALLAGNDLIITDDYERDFKIIKESIKNGEISEDLISKLAFRIIAWKYYKGLMFINEK